MSILINGGRIITAADDYVGDVYVEGERISMIGESLDVDADRVIDASGNVEAVQAEVRRQVAALLEVRPATGSPK